MFIRKRGEGESFCRVVLYQTPLLDLQRRWFALISDAKHQAERMHQLCSGHIGSNPSLSKDRSIKAIVWVCTKCKIKILDTQPHSCNSLGGE